ncbi:type III secretion system stalk subunit SctO [Prosthecomicrobium sp. N25]|uniref:type III secretion system stalk subunit SctO n=1 Tax=Prosthecomicrobium sp. N25 TaxID=3129254 RepID=UPI0030771963
MIGQLKVLLRVKTLKLDQAFRVMQAKRAQLEDAKAATAAARAIVEESRRTLPARIDAAYAAIIGSVVDLGRIDDVKGAVLALEQAHADLVDDLARAEHVEKRIAGELEEATRRYRQATKDRDKYGILTDELAQEIASGEAAREEVEIEDLFGRKRKKTA